jgi:hypothetical protein
MTRPVPLGLGFRLAIFVLFLSLWENGLYTNAEQGPIDWDEVKSVDPAIPIGEPISSLRVCNGRGFTDECANLNMEEEYLGYCRKSIF